jgi:hypothetical protein
MPFEFVCPHCHHKTKVDDKFAGQSGACVCCGRSVTMPKYDKKGMLVSSIPQSPSTASGSTLRKINWLPIFITLACLSIIMIVAIIGGVLAYPTLRQKASLAAQRLDSTNMTTIAQALNAYCDRYGTYPPPIVRDATGAPLYSWRVLILPFMGHEPLYNRFKLDQPHNSPANLSLLQEMPSEFGSKMTNAYSGKQTNYVLVTGPGTLFPPSGPLSRQNIDEPTILLVETVEGLGTWTEPVDLDTAKGAKMGIRPMKDMGGIHRDCVIIVTTKEQAFSVPTQSSQSIIDAMISPNGGEKVDISSFTEL